MEEEEDDHQTDNDALLDEFFFEGGDGTFDQIRPVVGSYNFHPFGQGGGDFLDLFFHPLDDIVRVHAETDHYDSANHFPGSVQFRRTPADVRAQNHLADIFHHDGRAFFIGPDDDVFNVGDVLNVAAAANHVFPAGKFQDPRPCIPVSLADVIRHSHDGNLISVKGVWVYEHLVLFDESADGSHFRDPRDRLQPVADIPILQGA